VLEIQTAAKKPEEAPKTTTKTTTTTAIKEVIAAKWSRGLEGGRPRRGLRDVCSRPRRLRRRRRRPPRRSRHRLSLSSSLRPRFHPLRREQKYRRNLAHLSDSKLIVSLCSASPDSPFAPVLAAASGAGGEGRVQPRPGGNLAHFALALGLARLARR